MMTPINLISNFVKIKVSRSRQQLFTEMTTSNMAARGRRRYVS